MLASIQQNKKLVWEFWQRLNDSRPDETAQVVKSFVSQDISWHGSHPINDLKGVDNVIERFWLPLRAAFPDLRIGCDLLIGGHEQPVRRLASTTGCVLKHEVLTLGATDLALDHLDVPADTVLLMYDVVTR